MATVTPPKRSRTLHEAQQTVRHPLERVRGTIRTYVGLEGVALLLTLLALWFWVSFVLDFGPFRLVGWDWVQEVARPARAFSLGGLFLAAVVLLRLELIGRLFGAEGRSIARTAFATTVKRQTLPVWLRLPLVGMAVPLLTLGAAAIFAVFGEQAVVVGAYVSALGVLPLTAFLIPALHELYGVRSSVSRWVRAPLAGLGAAGGALLGATITANATTGDLESAAGGVAVLIGAGIGAMAGDVFALVNIGVIAGLLRRQGYLVALAVPCVALYLLGWLLAGLAAAVSPILACALVVLLMVGPVLAVIGARLTRDFADPALALVLERRFPAVLGDRLITAVELANPKKAAALGYSEVMIEHTIHDAAERVQTVPVRDVFDWNRLCKQWGLVVLLTLGLYLVAGGLFCIPAVGETGAGERAGFAAFHQAGGLAIERNLLLQNTIWPRRAFLEVLDWPAGGDRERRVGKDDSAPSIKVRAYKWVIADPATAEGWRALTWNDLVKKKSLLGAAVPEVNFRARDEHDQVDWGEPRDPNAGWTLDEIELRLGREETHAVIEPDTKDALRDVLARLGERAADPAMRRTLRMLIVPTQVVIAYRGATIGGTIKLDRQGDNEYSGQFADLKESVWFTARGEDYDTPRYRIKVVPPPSLVEMMADEERPAYQFYRVRGDDPNALRGLKQLVAGRPVSVTGGDTSRIDPVPAGSNLVLTAKSDKELKEVMIEEPRKGVAAVQGDVRLLDPHTFQVRFDDVRATPQRPAYDFYFRFVDTDGVKGERHVVIKPHDDAAPEISIDVKVLRKTAQGYIVTPSAFVPLEGKVIDDKGLHLVEYACTVSKLDRQAEQSGRGLLVLSAMHLLPGGPGQELATAARIANLARESKTGTKGSNETGVQRFPVLGFVKQADEYQALDAIKANLGQRAALRAALTNTFLLERLDELDPRNPADARSFFNLDLVKNPAGDRLKVADRDEVQPRYRVQLWMEAIDTDVETGKEVLKTDKGVEYRGNRGVSKEKLTFIVVPENELLSEIAKEEEALYIKLGDQVARLQDGLGKLDRLQEDLTSSQVKADQFVSMQARCDELTQTLDKGESVVGEVYTDYQRILRELVMNRVETAWIERVQKQIVEPLNVALNGSDDDRAAKDNFPKVKAGIVDLRAALVVEGDLAGKVAQSRIATDEARLRANALIKRLTDVLDKMEGISQLNKVIEALLKIQQEENRQKDILSQISKELKDAVFESLGADKP